MSREANQRISTLLEEDEAARMLTHARTKADASKLQRLKCAGRLISPHRGLYVRPEAWSALGERDRALHLMRTLSRRHPGWVFCDISAGAAHGLSVPLKSLSRLHILTPAHAPTRSTDEICRHASSARASVMVDGIRMTTLEETTFDCLRRMGLRDGLALADSALRRLGLDDWERLADRVVVRHREETGLRKALAVLQLADARAESGGESIARATMLELGFQAPRLQVEIEDPLSAGRSYRVDFLWTLPDGRRVVGELDGHEKYQNPAMMSGRSVVEVLAAERLRESRLSAAGLTVMRFSYADVCNLRFFERLLEQYGIPRPGRPSRLRKPYREGWRALRLGKRTLRWKRDWPSPHPGSRATSSRARAAG